MQVTINKIKLRLNSSFFLLAAPQLSHFIIGFSEDDFISLSRQNYPLCIRYSDLIKAGTRVILQCNANLLAYRYFVAQQTEEADERFFGMCEVEAYVALSKSTCKIS